MPYRDLGRVFVPDRDKAGWAECQIDRASDVIERAFREVRDSGEYFTAVGMGVNRGQFLSSQGDYEAAAPAPTETMERAEAIAARLLQLQAATELAVLHEAQGDGAQVAKVLTPIYSWFTEGLDTPYLAGARAVLERP